MTNTTTGSDGQSAKKLRELAENKLRQKQAQLPEQLHALTTDEAQRLLHELRVHQIELEAQNEEVLHAQEQLRVSQARYCDLYERAPVGYITIGEDGRIQEANQTAASMLAVEKGALVGQPLTRFVMAEDQDILYLYRKTLENGSLPGCELRMLRSDSSAFWARLDSATGQRQDCSLECRMTLADITEKKAAETRQQALVKRLDLKRKQLSDFLYLVINGLSEPLMNLQGFGVNLRRDYSELLSLANTGNGGRAEITEPLKKRITAALDFIDENSAKTQQILGSVLKVYRAGQPEKAPETIAADDALKSVMKTLRPQLAECGGQVKSGRLLPCSASPGVLENILYLLISNSIKYRDSRRKLEISVSSERNSGGSVTYVVSDNGRGIKAADLPRIFYMFFRGDMPDTKKGEGISLPMAKILAENNDGSIRAESREGEGTVFFLTLPE